MGRLIEGLWDCKYYGTKGNRGSVRECPNCGRPRDENTKFYMPQTVTYVSEEKEKTKSKFVFSEEIKIETNGKTKDMKENNSLKN